MVIKSIYSQRLCDLAFRCLNGSASPYLAESVRPTADVEGRRHLRSSTYSPTWRLLSRQCRWPCLSRRCIAGMKWKWKEGLRLKWRYHRWTVAGALYNLGSGSWLAMTAVPWRKLMTARSPR